MYEFEYDFYERLAGQICSSLENIYYFNGSLTLPVANAEVSFTATLIIYRAPLRNLASDVDSIVDVVPVWWECSCISADGAEMLCDFDFAMLREAMLHR